MGKTVALCLCLVLGLAAPAAGERAGAPDCPANLPSRLTSTGSATQLITVVAPNPTSTRGRLRLWQKLDGCWRPVAGPWSAWLGGRGLSTWNQDKGQARAVREVVDAVRSGAPSPFAWDEIAATTRATFALLESARSGQVQRL